MQQSNDKRAAEMFLGISLRKKWYQKKTTKKTPTKLSK